jgi:putative DNA primase/helicase
MTPVLRVKAAVGKDVTDHLAAGYKVAEAVVVEPEATEPEHMIAFGEFEGPPYVRFGRDSPSQFTAYMARPTLALFEERLAFFDGAIDLTAETLDITSIDFEHMAYFLDYELSELEEDLFDDFEFRETGPEFWRRVEAAGLLADFPEDEANAVPVPEMTDDEDRDEPDEGERLLYEAAHAEVLVSAWRGQYRYAEHEGCWRHWVGGYWKKASDHAVTTRAQKVLFQHYGRGLAQNQPKDERERLYGLHRDACRHRSVRGGLEFLKGEPGFLTDRDEWNADPYALNCADGILDMRTQTLRPHDSKELCTRICRWSYGDTTTTGAWERHLALWLPNANIRRQVQRDLGTALVDAVLEHRLPIWYGIGRNGKSTTYEAILDGIGDYGHKAARDLLVATKYERHRTEIAELFGRRLVFSEEVDEGKQLAEATVKDMTGGGYNNANFMRQDGFTFKQTFSLFFLVNHKPKITGTDKGIWGRLRIVPWTVSLPPDEQRVQDDVVKELVADGSWMLRWMAAGYADWQRDPHWIAEEVLLATEEYRAEQDVLAVFEAERLEAKPRARVTLTEMYEAFTSWCALNEEPLLAKAEFGKLMKSRGYRQKRTAGKRWWLDVRLRVTTSDKVSVSPSQDDEHTNNTEPSSPLVTPPTMEDVSENAQGKDRP